MNGMKKTKEGVKLKKKKLLRLKNTGSILVLMGLLIIFVIALYTLSCKVLTLRPPLIQKLRVIQRVQMQYTNLWMEESAKKILIKSKINLMKRSNYIRIFLHISMKSEH